MELSFQRVRYPTVSNGGMVAAAHPLAASAGIDILRRNGNAMDAAIATALTTAVVMPGANGLGGDMFLLHCGANGGDITAINGSGAAPKNLSRDYFVSRDYAQMPQFGPLSVGVPGAVDAYFRAISRWCQLPVSDLFVHAIHYAENGFPLSVGQHRRIVSSERELSKYPSSAAIYLRDGRALKPGELLVNRDLANSLRLIRDGGPEAFYQGELAERIAGALQSAGGEMTVTDLSEHQGEFSQPISTQYRGYTVYQTALPTQGHIVLEELNILENADLVSLGHNSPEALHLMIEAKKRAFADRNAYSRDPRFGQSPLDTLLSKEFAKERFSSIDPSNATAAPEPGAIGERAADTTYLCTADAEGNMVSLIHSLSNGFGSQVVAADTGILLNNRVGRGFSLDPTHPNVIEGGKRTMHTLNCYAIARDDEVAYVGGTPGGDQQPQWNMQAITNMIDYNMDPQAAVEAPRWQSFPGTDPVNLGRPFEVRAESRIDESVIEALRSRGHVVKVLGQYEAGGAALIIHRDPKSGNLEGGADPRSEGFALGI